MNWRIKLGIAFLTFFASVGVLTTIVLIVELIR